MELVDGYVPVIDLTAARSGDPEARIATAGVIDQTCRASGFLVVVGHGINAELIARMHAVTLEYFSLPTATKRRELAVAGHPTVRGFYDSPSYIAASESIETPPDRCELFTTCRLGEPGVAEGAGLGDAFDTWSEPNKWPAHPATFKNVWLEYSAALEELAVDLMRLFALGLGLAEDFFDSMVDEHIAQLVANHYPAIDGEPEPGQYRKGPHSDWGTLTILYQDDTGGLEVQNRETGEWLAVPIIEGGFVVNIGDLMAIWTNDQWLSTKHRVQLPAKERRAVPRISIPFFHQPNWDAVIECLPSCTDKTNPPRHEPVASGAYLVSKIVTAFDATI